LVLIRPIRTTLVAGVARTPVAAIETVTAILPLLSLRTFLMLLALVAIATVTVSIDEFSMAFVVLAIVAVLRTLILEAGAAFAEHSEIVIRILQIIFGLHAVARELRVARHALIFLQELGGIAALAIVLAVARLSTEVPTSTLSPTTAPAAALSIVDQMSTSLRSELAPLGNRAAGTVLLGHRLLTLSFQSAH
jgi:hypothetical protein